MNTMMINNNQHNNPHPHALRLSPSRTVVTSFNPRQTPAPPSHGSSSNNLDYFSSNNNNTNNNASISSIENNYYDDGDWVLCVTASSSINNNISSSGTTTTNPYIGCALSNNEIQIYDPQRLHNTMTYKNVHGGNGIITDLVRASPYQHQQFQNILLSSGTDGKICVIDLRSQQSPSNSSQAIIQGCLPRSGEQALSVSLGYDGYLAAVASNQAAIHFFDLRQSNQVVGSYINSHTNNEITKVRFQQPSVNAFTTNTNNASSTTTTSPWLVSAGEDGLACIFDTSQPTEEAALKSILNVESPIRQIGFFGPNLEGIYCLTGSETISLWSWDTAQCIMTDHNIRSTLGGVDYLVNAWWDCGKQELQLIAGCSNGDTCLTTLDPRTLPSQAQPQQQPQQSFQPQQQQPMTTPWKTTHIMAGGHRGIVRDWCPISSSILVTVGEDARLCEWNLMGRQFNSATTSSKKSSITSSSASITSTTQNNSTQAMTQRRMSSGSMNASNNMDSSSGGGPVRRQRHKRTSGPY